MIGLLALLWLVSGFIGSTLLLRDQGKGWGEALLLSTIGCYVGPFGLYWWAKEGGS